MRILTFQEFVSESLDTNKKLIKVIKSQIDFPEHKLSYVINHYELLKGLYDGLTRYGFEKSNELVDVLMRQIEIKLVGHDGVEYEWTDNEYNNFEKLKNLSESKSKEEKVTPSISDIRKEVLELVYANKYLTNPDGDTIFYAKQLARKYKIKYQEILAGMRPAGSINTNVWDETGKIVPYKRIFGGY